ncbi:MAG: ribosomal-processing cysteine protease Prp [Lachnospiraceae bacterium]|nr:ribosomal-processing cysteine protease Prp [Lachnospiraceae bacterium]
MTTITITKSQNGNYKQMTCSGHAGYADAGEDIVCAAISMLVINTINSLEALTDTKMQVHTAEESGTIDLKFQEDLSSDGRLLMDSLVLGLKSVVKQYGRQYVKLKFKEV